jgi:hypothetical protein
MKQPLQYRIAGTIAQAHHDLRTEIQTREKNGKPTDTLFKPGNPDYFLSPENVAKYVLQAESELRGGVREAAQKITADEMRNAVRVNTKEEYEKIAKEKPNTLVVRPDPATGKLIYERATLGSATTNPATTGTAQVAPQAAPAAPVAPTSPALPTEYKAVDSKPATTHYAERQKNVKGAGEIASDAVALATALPRFVFNVNKDAAVFWGQTAADYIKNVDVSEQARSARVFREQLLPNKEINVASKEIILAAYGMLNPQEKIAADKMLNAIKAKQ